MKLSHPLIWLSILVTLLASIASGTGLFWQESGSSFSFTTLHGQTVEIYGKGLYHYDTAFKAPILRGTDAVTLFVVVPLLIVAILLTLRGSLRGQLLLAAGLAYCLYNAASLAFGAAYNNFILVYMAFFSTSLFGLITAFTTIDLPDLAARVLPRVPRRGMAIFMFATSLTLFVWLPDMLGSLLQGSFIKGLASYTTEVTYILDPGVIAPTAFLTGLLLLKRKPIGYLLAAIMLVVNALVGIMVIGQWIMQTLDGIVLTPVEIIAFNGSFMLTGLIAGTLAARFFAAIADPAFKSATFLQQSQA